ncbi:hypothetical protein G9A89_021592 [Geosiphon pyriformis]|nr:hypothetical protein G9A89_021592 [Geosiphon pyriformis]
MPLTEIYMALRSTSNWAEKTEQKIFEESRRWKKHIIENDLDLQREVENGTTHLNSHVKIYYQKNATGLILQ